MGIKFYKQGDQYVLGDGALDYKPSGQYEADVHTLNGTDYLCITPVGIGPNSSDYRKFDHPYNVYEDINGNPYDSIAALMSAVSEFFTSPLGGVTQTQIVNSDGNILLPTGTPVKIIQEITRPSDITAYAAGDAIGAYAVAVKQKDTVTLSGTSGSVNISIPNIANRTIPFAVGLTETAAAFVTTYAADFLPLVVVTSSGADIVFEAATAGVPFEHPAAANTIANLAGSVVNTTANVTLSSVEFEDMSISNGGGGFITGVKIESNITAMASTTQRLWLYNEAPALVSGDNTAFLISYADRDKLMFFVDVEMQALETGSDSVVGYITMEKGYNCADFSLFGRLQTKTIFTPTSGGKINISLYAIKLS